MSQISTVRDTTTARLVDEGATTVPGAALLGSLDGAAWAELAAQWEDLPRDEHLADGGEWRQRRHGLLRARPAGHQGYVLEPLPAAPFQQSADLIPLYGGKARTFAPVDEGALGGPALRTLLQHDLELVARAEGERRPWRIQLHMIRVLASASEQIAPAPEGRHSDGHAYVAMHLIGRERCEGGVSRIYTAGSKVPFLITTMTAALDTVVIDDRRVEHEVTPITTSEETATRDLLLADFDPDPEG
jgi:hypothetical protein